jgi:hypothetical protein
MNNTVIESNVTTAADATDCSLSGNGVKQCHVIPNPQNNGSTNLSLGGFTGNGNQGGTSTGGSSIGTGVDDSAVTGLMQQSVGNNRATAKANFIEKLIFIGYYLEQTVITLYDLFGLLGMIFIFLMIFSIPQKMKEGIRDLFKAGGNR